MADWGFLLQDWDFKWEKGNCLNSLGSTKFNICHSSLVNPSSNIPKAVKRVHEIYDKPVFMENILPGDIKQGNLGNCWFVASLTGLANVPDGIKRNCVEYDTSESASPSQAWSIELTCNLHRNRHLWLRLLS